MVVKAHISDPLPVTDQSQPVILEPYALDTLPGYCYTQTEFLVSGTAKGARFCTRMLVRHPQDMAHFNGRALLEVSHIWGGTSVWRAYHRQLMRAGYMWIELDSQAPSALDLIKGKDPVRYSDMEFLPGELASDFAATIPFTENPTPEELAAEYDAFKQRWWAATPQSFEIIAQVAARLREDLPTLPNSAVASLGFAGISQTGGVVRKFIEDHHNTLRLEDGSGVFDVYFPGASGGPALPDVDAKIIEILGESEFQSVRWPCGVSGQTRGLTHRRQDSDSFRLYEVAGMAHRETRRMSDRDVQRLKDCPLPEGSAWSKFPNTHVYNAIMELGFNWAEGKETPPASMFLETVGETDTIVRDEFGNALGGYRTTFTDAPHSSLLAATPMGRPSWYHGSERQLTPEELRQRYGNVEGYRSVHGQVLERMLGQKLILPEDAEELRLESETVHF